ncbi:acetyltransferase (GNAT) family protein [Luteibacter sp. OK325]|uniref:GNAT family N-acetyltransferase n=1 Tax=Luteibacter sp. OK325 TaxID=2135670 RepID=UPI000D3823C9|nr:GNAT family N-acetyltransferase [Luteibacter sp. OK325]PTR30770.1 acetyltransferase (GNAT) family protein [Luteibacter sp. OK325]
MIAFAHAKVCLTAFVGSHVAGVSRDLLTEHFLTLSDEGRFQRFLRRMDTEAIDAHVEHLLADAHALIIASQSNRIRGLAELYISLQEPSAEVGLSVLERHQGQGIGTSMTTMLIRIAEHARCTALSAVTLMENSAARALLKNLGFRQRGSGEECHATLLMQHSDDSRVPN